MLGLFKVINKDTSKTLIDVVLLSFVWTLNIISILTQFFIVDIFACFAKAYWEWLTVSWQMIPIHYSKFVLISVFIFSQFLFKRVFYQMIVSGTVFNSFCYNVLLATLQEVMSVGPKTRLSDSEFATGDRSCRNGPYPWVTYAIIVTHFRPIFLFYIPWKHQGFKMGTLARNDLVHFSKKGLF